MLFHTYKVNELFVFQKGWFRWIYTHKAHFRNIAADASWIHCSFSICSEVGATNLEVGQSRWLVKKDVDRLYDSKQNDADAWMVPTQQDIYHFWTFVFVFFYFDIEDIFFTFGIISYLNVSLSVFMRPAVFRSSSSCGFIWWVFYSFSRRRTHPWQMDQNTKKACVVFASISNCILKQRSARALLTLS